MPFAEARDAAILPAFVGATATAITSAVSVAPILRSITSSATSTAATTGTNVVLRSLTGESAKQIVQSSIPVFVNVMGQAGKQFGSEFMESMVHGMATEYATNGTITLDNHVNDSVLEGLTGMAAAGVIAGPFGLVNTMSPEVPASDTFRSTRPEEAQLNEYIIPQLEYTPATEQKLLGYTPSTGPTDTNQTVLETRDNSAFDIAEQLDIDIDTATEIANGGIGATVIDAINESSSDQSTRIDATEVIVNDAFGNPITYASAVGAIVTGSPVINLEIGTEEQRAENTEIVKGVYEKLNIDPEQAVESKPKYHPQVEKGLAEGRIDPDDAQWMSDYANTPGKAELETGTGSWKDQSEKMQNFVARMERGEIPIPPHMERDYRVQLGGNTSGLNVRLGGDELVPQMQPSLDQQNVPQKFQYKERPDIRNIFNTETLFEKPVPVAQPDLAQASQIQLSTAADSATATDLLTKLNTNTLTETDLAVAIDLVIKLQTEVQIATDPRVKIQLQQDLDVVTKLAESINVKLNAPADAGVSSNANTDLDLNPDLNLNLDIDLDLNEPKTKKSPTKKQRTVSGMRAALKDSGGIFDLGPAFTRAKTNYKLAGQFGMATGGSVATGPVQYDPFGLANNYTSENSGVVGGPAIFDPKSPFVGSNLKMPRLTVGKTKPQLNYELAGYPTLGQTRMGMADGGLVDHDPQFFSEGGLGTLENRYVSGDGDGTSDEVPAMLANGEFVIPADVVSKLGNGSNDAGASVLDQFLMAIREHNQKHNPKNLPPDSKGPLAYLLEAKKRA
jgi:hypothetical protein